jgi:integrase
MKPNYRRRVLRLPDLDHCKLAVLNSLGSPASRRVYEYAIDQFIAWYCSEPRLAFNRIVVVRYRMHLESRGLAANTINQQLAAVRRLAHEAADSGLLSPELAAGISRVKGVKQLGFRSGNWLSADQSSEVLNRACGNSMRAKRDYAMLAMLFGCGFRRSELVGLELDEIQMRQSHWAVVDEGQGRPHPHCPNSSMGKSSSRSVDPSSLCYGGENLSSRRQDGKGVGERHFPECCVVRGQDLLRKSRLGAYCTA